MKELTKKEDYIYHTTFPKNLKSVKTAGLKPQGERRIFFSQDVKNGARWGNKGDPLFRVIRQDVQGLQADSGAYNTVSTRNVVPPELIDVSFNEGRTWESLTPKQQLTDIYAKAAAKAPVEKQAWQMTREELKTYNKEKLKIAEKEGKDIYFYNNLYPADDYSLRRIHKESVSQAIKEGKPVPKEVLVEYPALAKKITPTKSIPKELEPLAREAMKYKSAEEFERAINEAIESPNRKGDMIGGVKFGDTTYSYKTAMDLDKAGYKDIKPFYKKATAKAEKPAVQKELKLLVKEAGIREWQDIPELDAQIRTIKEPDPKDKDDIFWTVKIGLQESLGEQGGDIITEFYKGEPTLKDIKRDIINTYKEKKIEINKEVAIGITVKSGRDEMIERVIDKILGKQTLTR